MTQRHFTVPARALVAQGGGRFIECPKTLSFPLASLEAGLRATAECVCQGERCPQRGGKDAAPGMKGALGLPGGRQQLTPGASPRTCPHPLHPRSTQPKPFRASPSRAAIAVSPTYIRSVPCPAWGGPGAGLVLQACRGAAELCWILGTRGVRYLFFPPETPKRGCPPLGLISHSAVPTLLAHRG